MAKAKSQEQTMMDAGGEERSNSPTSSGGRNPRRCSPEESVSLRPHLKSNLAAAAAAASNQSTGPTRHNGANDNNNVGRPVTMALRQQKSMPKVSPSQSSASRWFDQANQDVQPRSGGFTHDSPFYIGTQRHSSSEDDRPGAPWGTARLDSRDSENSDLRDVIDDLTVENKKLRKRLLKYERGQDSDMNRDKMFEVRVHGLSSSKKRDLEELLTNFVTKMNTKGKRAPQAASSTNNSSNQISDTSRQSKSQYPFTDSAYASMSQTGPTSASRSGPTSNSNSTQSRFQPRVSTKSRDKDIKSYLHNIPESLLPRLNPVMSDRAKKKIVVQRLEHLFTGKSAAPGPHSQPMQQQEVSKAAAQEGKPNSEGSREARIMSAIRKREERRKDSNSEGSDDSPLAPGVDSKARWGNQSPDQRPTRPLDLDIHRAQVPAENMEYIRHLGLNSPVMRIDDKGSSDGWIYLNLLISMAQLHTINVTPEFIKKAITDMSDKFELSPDGRKIRWKGGDEGTRFQSDSGSNTDVVSGGSPEESTDSLNTNSNFQSKNASKSSSAVNSSRPIPSNSMSGKLMGQSSSDAQQSSSLQQKSKESSAFDYKPIIFKNQRSSAESDEYMFPEYESSYASRTGLEGMTGQSSSHNAAHSEARQSQHSGGSDGAIIFYRNAPYCSDYGGDRRAFERSQGRPVAEAGNVVGLHSDHGDDDELERDTNRRAQSAPPKPFTEGDVAGGVKPLKLVPLSDVTEQTQDFQEFPVSGLGGVVPADNFLVDVRTQHHLRAIADGKAKAARKQPLKGHKVVSASKLDLPPSRLPPPSYIFMPVTSSSSSDLDASLSDDELTDSSLNEDMPAPAAMMTRFSSGSVDESSDEEDDSIDMLDSARAVDPAAIAAREKEYDLTNLEKFLKEELPAGSSAATAGGGSGWNSREGSPGSMDLEPPTLKRGRSTTDSMAVSRSRKSQRTE